MSQKEQMKFVVDVFEMIDYAERFNRIEPIKEVEQVENPDLEYHLKRLKEFCGEEE